MNFLKIEEMGNTFGGTNGTSSLMGDENQVSCDPYDIVSLILG